jgi:diguanylate cyclase (GGDEF)-like protein
MARYDLLSSIVFFDLNGFKSINDRFGHGIGDQLLLTTGKVLLEGVRDCDMVARLGGDEFGILLFKTDARIAQAKASALACRIAEQTVEMPTGDVSVTAAWGVAPCDADDTAEQILARADRAMYIAKKSD